MKRKEIILLLFLFCCLFNSKATISPPENGELSIISHHQPAPDLATQQTWLAVYDNSETDKIRKFSIQAGLWYPIGDLQRIFTAGVSLGLKYPMFSNFPHYLDFGLNFYRVFTSDYFGVYTGDRQGVRNFEDVKGIGIFDMGLWYRYKKQIGNSVYWNSYLGFGVEILRTDKTYEAESLKYDEYYDEYYWTTETERYIVAPVFINMGMDIRYRSGGVFVEFKNAFYKTASGPPQIDGGASFRIGVNLKLF